MFFTFGLKMLTVIKVHNKLQEIVNETGKTKIQFYTKIFFKTCSFHRSWHWRIQNVLESWRKMSTIVKNQIVFFCFKSNAIDCAVFSIASFHFCWKFWYCNLDFAVCNIRSIRYINCLEMVLGMVFWIQFQCCIWRDYHIDHWIFYLLLPLYSWNLRSFWFFNCFNGQSAKKCWRNSSELSKKVKENQRNTFWGDWCACQCIRVSKFW